MEQYSLDGEVVEDTSTATSTIPPAPARPGQQLALPVTVAKTYRSRAWKGTVTEEPLPLDTSDWLTDEEYERAWGPDGRGGLE